MARIKNKTLTAAIRAPFFKRFGVNQNTANSANALAVTNDWAHDNTFEQRWRNAADTDDVRALTVDSDNKVYVAEAAVMAGRKTVEFVMDTNGSIATQAFFIADRAYRIASVTYMSRVVSSVAGTLYVEKISGATAPGSGTSVQSGTFDLTATAATVLTGTLATTNSADSDNPDLLLATGDRLGVVVAGTITSLVGVVVTVTLAPAGSGKSIVFNVKATADLAFTSSYFFVASRPYIITRIDCTYSTAGPASLKCQLTKDTSTNAPGAGTALLTNNTNAGFDLTAAVNTVQNGALAAAAATLRLAAGDRISVKLSSGTVTGLVGLVVQVTLQETAADRKEVVFALDHVPGAADLVGWNTTAFFTADRDYEVLDVQEVHKTATGGAAKVTVTADTGTTAPGGGTVLVTQNTNAGFDLNATAATPQAATLPAASARFLTTGDRLSVKPSGTLTSGVNVVIAVSLAAR